MPGFFFAGIACRLGRRREPPGVCLTTVSLLRFYLHEGAFRLMAAFLDAAAGIADGFVDDGLHKFRTSMNLNEFTRIAALSTTVRLRPG